MENIDDIPGRLNQATTPRALNRAPYFRLPCGPGKWVQLLRDMPAANFDPALIFSRHPDRVFQIFVFFPIFLFDRRHYAGATFLDQFRFRLRRRSRIGRRR